MVSGSYRIVAGDLRNIPKLEEELIKETIDPKYIYICKYRISTLVLTEVVLVYMENENSNNLINWISTYFQNVSILNYEMINPLDPFGKVMLTNLEVII